MKLYKVSYDVARPSNKIINVPTDINNYAVGVKFLKDGEESNKYTAKIDGKTSTSTFDGHQIFYMSSGSDTTPESKSIIARGYTFDQTVSQTYTNTKYPSITVNVYIYWENFIGKKVSYKNLKIIEPDGTTADSISIRTDNSDPNRKNVILYNGDATTIYKNGPGIYFYRGLLNYEYQEGLEEITIDEHMTQTQVGQFTVYQGETKTGYVRMYCGDQNDIGTFKLQINHSDESLGDITAGYVNFLNLHGFYTDGTTFDLNIPRKA